jgi:hypothetical protein
MRSKEILKKYYTTINILFWIIIALVASMLVFFYL